MRVTVLPFIAAAGLGSFLLFSIEPMVGRLVLPELGGSPAVWNTCMLFFQLVLLAAYAWVHFGTRWLGVGGHAVAHGAILGLSLLALPPALDAGWSTRFDLGPIAGLILALLLLIGLPFFVLASTGPLVQKWFAGTTHPHAHDPYFLYAASNLGSLAGLVAYPVLIAPLLGLHAQATTWAWVYVALLVLLAFSAWPALRGRGASTQPVTAAAMEPRPGSGTWLRWTFFAFVPSALLLTVTTHVTTDIAPVPLLWILPLAIYLAAFALAFARAEGRWVEAAARIMVPLLLTVGVLLLFGYDPVWSLPLHVTLFAAIAFAVHGRLARERPEAARLTTFYLWIGVGGALGGVFAVLVAPLLLWPTTEYLLLLVLAALAKPGLPPQPVSARTGIVVIAAFVALIGAAALLSGSAWMALPMAVAFLLLLGLIERIGRAPVPLTLALATVFLGVGLARPGAGDVRHRVRNFHGTLTVDDTPELRRLVHGRTLHGAQFLAVADRRIQTTYYSQAGPLGDLFDALGSRLAGGRIGVVGLGAGTAACYARPGQSWEFFEINPAVVRIARDTTLFRFLTDCTPEAALSLGDARLTLADRPHASYRLLLLDAFSSDAIPVHLMTEEAFRLFVSRLEAGGTLIVHLSNKYLSLAPVVAEHAAALELGVLQRADRLSEGLGRMPSHYAVLTADARLLEALSARGWQPLPRRDGFRPWTDDYSSVLSVLRLRGD